MDVLDTSFLDSDIFLIGYYILTVGASLLLIKDTKKRIKDLKIGISSMKYAPIASVSYTHLTLPTTPYV